jgi:hypothetical protein
MALLFATPQEINSYYDQLKLVGKLDSHSGTPDVYVDKARNLRGRKRLEYKEGYNTFHPSELSNEMLDDFKLFFMNIVQHLRKITTLQSNFKFRIYV